jgi:hypothetical protein
MATNHAGSLLAAKVAQRVLGRVQTSGVQA